MAEKEHIEREALLERIDDIWDCADLVFEPNDQIIQLVELSSLKEQLVAIVLL